MIKVLGKRVLIEEVVEDIKSKGGIILGDTKTSAQRIGKVISKGDLVEEISLGDKVLFDGHRVAPLDFDGKTYLIMEENTVIGVFI
jgi:chaperonin GroES